jgi:hypothetical protein
MRYSQYTKQVVDEVAMNPTEFGKAISQGDQAGVLVGFEFEVCMPETVANSGEEGDGTPELSHEFISDMFMNNDLFGNMRLRELSPREFDALFTAEEPLVDSMMAAYDVVLGEKIEYAKDKISAISSQSRSYYLKAAKKLLSDLNHVEQHYSDNEELENQYNLYRSFFRCMSNAKDWTAARFARNSYDAMTIDYDDLFPEFLGIDSSDVDTGLNDYLSYDPEEVWSNMNLEEYRDDDYDDSDKYYRRGASVLAPIVAHAFGAQVHIFDSYHEQRKNLTDWYIEPDGSLEANDESDSTMEVVSPPLPALKAIDAVKTFYGVAKRYNLYTNNSTGLHINISIPKTLDVLKLALFLGEAHVLEKFERQDNGYVRSVIQSLSRNIEDEKNKYVKLPGTPTREKPRAKLKPSTATKIDYAMLGELVKRISSNHTASISDNGGYLSFRHAGDDYLQNQQDVINVVGRFVRAMIIASDESAYKQEYLKKLYQLTDKAGAYGKEWNQKSAALSTINEIRQNGVPVLVAYFSVDDSKNAQKTATKIAYDLGGRNDMWELQRSQAARTKLLNTVQTATINGELQQRGEDCFYAVQVFPNMNSYMIFKGDQKGGIQLVSMPGNHGFGYYVTEKATVPMNYNAHTKNLMSQLITRYQSSPSK